MAHRTILTQLRDTKSLQPQQFSHLCTHERTLGNNCAHTHSQSEYCLPHWGCEGDVSAALHAPSLFLSHWRHVQRQHTLAPSSTTFPHSLHPSLTLSPPPPPPVLSSNCLESHNLHPPPPCYTLAAHRWLRTHTHIVTRMHVRTHRDFSVWANVLSTHAAINSTIAHTQLPVHR